MALDRWSWKATERQLDHLSYKLLYSFKECLSIISRERENKNRTFFYGAWAPVENFKHLLWPSSLFLASRLPWFLRFLSSLGGRCLKMLRSRPPQTHLRDGTGKGWTMVGSQRCADDVIRRGRNTCTAAIRNEIDDSQGQRDSAYMGSFMAGQSGSAYMGSFMGLLWYVCLLWILKLCSTLADRSHWPSHPSIIS